MGIYATGLTGLVKLTKAQYNSMEAHDANTKYIVKDGNSVMEYLGDILIGSGNDAVAGTPDVKLGGTVLQISEAIYGTMERSGD